MLTELKILFRLNRVKFLQNVENKAMLVGTFINMFLTLISYVLFWGIIAAIPKTSIEGIYGTWTSEELLVLVAFAEMAFAMDSLTFYGVSSLSEYIISGLETLLVRPGPPLLYVCGSTTEPVEGITGLLSSLIMIIAAVSLEANFSLPGFFLGIFAILLGTVAMGYLYATISTLAFWIGRISFIENISSSFYVRFIRSPLDIFPKAFIRFVTFGIPLFFLATYPTLSTLGKISIHESIMYLGIVTVLMFLWRTTFRIIWRQGLKRYQGVWG